MMSEEPPVPSPTVSPTKNVPSDKKKVAIVRKLNQIPDEIKLNPVLNAAIDQLPSNYNFEIHKTVWRILKEQPSLVALQFPEGLLMYSCIIADIISQFARVKVIILGDVTYGACCVDDFTAKKMGVTFLVHYGHSCLIPIDSADIKVLYVFVEISFDVTHLVEILCREFPPSTRLAIMGTVQFTSAIQDVLSRIRSHFPEVRVSQAKPLSQGETLGCTSPVISDSDALIFIADGRFHLESVMIQNPTLPAYRYDPYAKELTVEGYDVERMKAVRLDAIERFRSARTIGLILGTLGRQGSPGIFKRLRKLITESGRRVILFLMAEINPVKLSLIAGVEAWVQVACPRLSIDWGAGFSKPVLTPYEVEVALSQTAWSENYPMDYYSNSGGPWANMYHRLQNKA